MQNIQIRRSLTQPCCYECHRSLTIYICVEKEIDGNSTWGGGIPLRGGKSRIFLCTSHPLDTYEQDGYILLGTFEWEKGIPV